MSINKVHIHGFFFSCLSTVEYKIILLLFFVLNSMYKVRLMKSSELALTQRTFSATRRSNIFAGFLKSCSLNQICCNMVFV